MATRRFELLDGNRARFWEVEVDGATVRTRYGRIGRAGRVAETEAGDAAEALELAEKRIREKTREGYAEVAAGGASPGAPSAAPPKAPAKAPARKPAKKPRPPRKSSEAYQTVARGWRALVDTLQEDEVSPERMDEDLARLLAEPEAVVILDAEGALHELAAVTLYHQIQTDEDLVKLFAGDPPEDLEDARRRNETRRRHHALDVEAKQRLLVRLLAAGCDPFRVPRTEGDTPLERFVWELPARAEEARFSHPWRGGAPGTTTVLDVLEAFAQRGENGVAAAPGQPTEAGCGALAEAAAGGIPVFDWILAKGPDAPSSLRAWPRLFPAGPGLPNEAWKAERVGPLARHLAALGAGGLVAGDGPGALLLAIQVGAQTAIDALEAAGVALDAPATATVTTRVHVPTHLLPEPAEGDVQNQPFRVEKGATARDVAEALLALYDSWEGFLGDREGTAFGSFGHARREAHERIRALVQRFAGRGLAVSGKPAPKQATLGEPLPAEVKARIDAALTGVIERLGGETARAAARLAGLDGGRLETLAYLRLAAGTLQPLVPEAARSGLGQAWLGELLGYADSLAGVDPDDLGDYDPETRAALREGTWLGTRGDAVALLDRTGRVVRASVRGGVEVLAPDLLRFITEDLAQLSR